MRPTISPSGETRTRAQNGTCAPPSLPLASLNRDRTSGRHVPYITTPTDSAEDEPGPPWPAGRCWVDTPITKVFVILDETGKRVRTGGR